MLKKFFCASLAVFTIISLAQVQSQKQKVDDLFNGLYTHDIYSGYLSTGANEDHKLYYVFTPSQSNPSSDPLILWLNGGPGCSSLFSLLVETGPVVINEEYTSFKLNEYAWNKNANVLYIESPPGVGYTINLDPEIHYNDTITSEENLNAFIDFIKMFPEYENNSFYLAGESYSGVYIPYFLKAYYSQSEFKMKVKGVFIGNGLTDFESDVERSMVEFGYNYGIVSLELMKEFRRNCPHVDYHTRNVTNDKMNDLQPRKVTKRCNEIRRNIKDSFEGIDIYGVFHQCSTKGSSNERASEGRIITSIYDRIKNSKLSHGEDETLFSGQEYENEAAIWPSPCVDDPFLETFLNSNEIKQKLHVDSRAKKWLICNHNIFLNYTLSDSLSLYEDVLFKNNLQTWFYSGDSDACVPTIGTFNWIQKLKLKIITEYRQWHGDNQVAGFLQEYEKNFVLLVVKGAGHMAPMDKRQEMFIALTGFLKNELPK